ncbi:defense protein l(2)34Fc-like [Panulirus ornatus]|uniref:defense protein l(2)34Fc-like n=1 Tax=Panulirus ornatus TaxID=150431 RepID=UPI003A8BC744
MPFTASSVLVSRAYRLLLLLLAGVGEVWSYPDYVPQTTCKWMAPKHDPYGEPAPGPPPYRLVTYHPRVLSEMPVPVCLVGALPLMGFMIQAQDENGVSLGSWIVDDPKVGQTMNCTMAEDTVTHVSKQHKQVVSFHWLPPANYSGTIVFKAVVVKEYSTFWTDITSKTFSVHHL